MGDIKVNSSLQSIFSPSGLTPHGFCLIWQPGLIWLHAASDAVTAVAYYSIPFCLIRFARLRPNISYSWLLYVFAIFIVACGTTHLLSIYTLWVPAYWLEGGVKLITASVSIVTAFVLWPLVDRIAELPSPADLREANRALRASQSFLRRTGKVAGVGGWEFDIRSQKITCSEQIYDLLNLPRGNFLTQEDAAAFYSPELLPRIAAAVEAGISHDQPFDLEMPLLAASGREIWARIVGAVERDGDRPARLVGALQDISTRKAIERELSDQKALLEVTLEAIGNAVGDAVITTDLHARVNWLNSVAERLTGWCLADAIGRPVEEIFITTDEKTGERLPCTVLKCLEPGANPLVVIDKRLVSRFGIQYDIEKSAAPIYTQTGEAIGAVVVFRDISERRRIDAEISHKASHDALTGLYNREAFDLRLTKLILSTERETQSNAVLYIDLDEFKVVNDSCGHSVGDTLLKQVSAILRSSVRINDIVARLGGDEFGIILVNCSGGPALRVAQSICRKVAALRFVHDTRRFQVGASVGLVQLDRHWDSAGAVMQAADSCCYVAKDSGRNRVYVWREDDQTTQARSRDMQWVSLIEAALENDYFELFAQRIEPLGDGPRGTHIEILLRMSDPTGQLLLPGAFVRAAERFHMATRIDHWVVQHVFLWLGCPTNRHHKLDVVAINLSGQSIGDRAFHGQILSLLDEANFDISCICFEITETSAVANMVDAISFITQMRARGVRIALDDFGAGVSSFGYLKALPVDCLKIDGQFIQNFLHDELDRAAVRCFCEIARIRNITTIAEYVEEEGVRDALEAMGIDKAQGFLFHRPERLETLLPKQIKDDLAPE